MTLPGPPRAGRSGSAAGTSGPLAAPSEGARPLKRKITLEPSAAQPGVTHLRIIGVSGCLDHDTGRGARLHAEIIPVHERLVSKPDERLARREWPEFRRTPCSRSCP